MVDIPRAEKKSQAKVENEASTVVEKPPEPEDSVKPVMPNGNGAASSERRRPYSYHKRKQK